MADLFQVLIRITTADFADAALPTREISAAVTGEVSGKRGGRRELVCTKGQAWAHRLCTCGPMEKTAIAKRTDQQALDTLAEPISEAVKQAYQSAGSVGQVAKNAMHGVWLG